MSDQPKSIWTSPDNLEDRVAADLDIIKGVLELAKFADYADRKGAINDQLVDAAIHNACHGASQIADDLEECVEQLLTDHLNQERVRKAGGEQ